MKRILFTLTAFFALASSAKSPDELRIYINPGHGGWTADDRPCQLVNHPQAYTAVGTDTCSFFESNTDLEKGFGLMERLIDYGLAFDRSLNQTGVDHTTGAARDLENNIVMSRVKNGPYLANNKTESQYGGAAYTPKEYYWYNRSLTEIAEEVQVNNFDMFISIHSNAAGDVTSNYPLYLYRGYDDCRQATYNDAAMQRVSRAMAEACWDYGYENPHSYWSHFKTSKYIKGDLDFYGDNGVYATRSDGTRVYGYLGALRHSVPGFLVEGYFHTYQPARHRAMNWDVCRLEGIAYAHGIADYFGLQKEDYGTIYGIVRDAEEKFTDTYYKPAAGSDDVYKPLNGATVTLMKDGVAVSAYTTDDNYNGAFVFDRLSPGIYTVSISHPEYSTLNSAEPIEVKAAAVAYPKYFLSQRPAFRKSAVVYGMETAFSESAGVEFRYSLSADVEDAAIILYPMSMSTESIDFASPEVKVYPVATEAGEYSFSPGILEFGDYAWALRYTTFENTKAGEIFAVPSGLTGVRGGVVPVTDSRYPTFGYTLVAHGMNNGVDIYDPSGVKTDSRLWKNHEVWGKDNLTSNYDPCRGTEREGKAVFAAWGDNACGLTIVDPLGIEGPEEMYGGTITRGAGHYTFNGTIIGGGTPAVCFLGEDDETLLYTFSEDHNGTNGKGATDNSIVCYNIGKAMKLWDAPTVIGHKELLANTNVDLVAYGNGFFASQNRAAGQNTAVNPAFAYIEAENHTVTFNSGVSLPSLKACSTGLAITADGKTLAVSDYSAINIYAVEWSGDVPSLSPLYTIPFRSDPTWVNLRFDAAGNLHSYETANGGYHVYALKQPSLTRTVEANTAFSVDDRGVATGLDSLKAAFTNADAEIYTLSGIKVKGRPQPGIYIRRTGVKTKKIVIK